MARRIREEDLQAIEAVVQQHPEGRTAQQISDALRSAPRRRTLQYRLKSLVDSRRLIMDGSGPLDALPCAAAGLTGGPSHHRK